MGSERYILKRLLEGVEPDTEMERELDERTYYAQDGTQYWKRNGKFCKWTEEGGRVEITEEEYQKALASDGVSTKRTSAPTKAEAPKKEDAKEEPINVQGHTINYNPSTKYWDVKDANGKTKMEAMTKDDAIGFAKGEPESKEATPKATNFGDTPTEYPWMTKEEQEALNSIPKYLDKPIEQWGDYSLTKGDEYLTFDNIDDLKKELEYRGLPNDLLKMSKYNVKDGMVQKSKGNVTITAYPVANPEWDAAYDKAAKAYKARKAPKKSPEPKLGDDISYKGKAYTIIKHEGNGMMTLRPTDKIDDYEEALSGNGDSFYDIHLDKSQLSGNKDTFDTDRARFKDDSESDYISYNGCRDFDHTSWDIDGMETTIQRNPNGAGYYIQNEDFDMEFNTKKDLVDYLRDSGADYIGQDSENDY